MRTFIAGFDITGTQVEPLSINSAGKKFTYPKIFGAKCK